MCIRDRKIDGCPVPYTSAIGGGLEDMDSTIETWTYEHLSIVISKEGLAELSSGSPYALGEVLSLIHISSRK